MYRILLAIVLCAFVGANPDENHTLKSGTVWKNSSVLSGGKWVKIRTDKKGIYKITYDKLKSWGFSSPEFVNVYGNGGMKLSESLSDLSADDLTKNRTWRGKDASGKDCLFFFSTGSVDWQWEPVSGLFIHTVNPYSEDCYYFLSQEGNSAYTVETLPSLQTQPTHQVTSFNAYTRYETEQYNLINSGQQWFGEKFIRSMSRKFLLSCENPVSGQTASLLINVAGRSEAASSFDIAFNQVKQTGIVFNVVYVDNPTSLYADEKQKILTVPLSSATAEIGMTYNATNSLSEAWLDFITLNWRRSLKMTGDELSFRDTRSLGVLNIAQFTLEEAGSGIKVFDITNPLEIKEIPVTEQGSQTIFKRPSAELREYLAFKPAGNFPEPVYVGEVGNQNLHAMDIPELLVVTYPDFLAEALKVADFHKNYDGMKVAVATTLQIYNEFGSGKPDATAIRNFVKMCYEKSKNIKYVLLFGDGSFDNRNLTGANKAYIPTWQSDESLLPTGSFVSDDYFVILENGESVYNGTEDLGIGRLPVSTSYEAGIVAEKIMNYYTPESMGIWRTNLCFIGDDGDGSLHMGDSESLAEQVNAAHGEFQTEKIYFDAYPQETTPAGERYPDVTEAINQQVKKGVLILNYVGHANTRFLSDERVLDVSTINSWTNRDNLPIFVTATCEFSRFDDSETSAGEYILLNPKGGGIGLFSTTRVVYAYSNYLLSKAFYQYAFQKDSQGNNFRMGDIMRLAKINTDNTINKRNFTLLADPALRLSYPKHHVVTSTINQKVAGSVPDTLHALSKVTITGEITNHSGQRLTSFNGQVTAVVYDKAMIQKTLGNAGETPFSYKTQNSIIYRGESSVKNGTFSFSFVVPKDISYSLGTGRILYYAQNGTEDAHGVYENFVIGGSEGSQVTDDKGPSVQLFMDDSTFTDGGSTSRNPLLLAYVSDENGINTVGTGIGHEITAVLDDDYSNVFVLNDFYSSARDDYKKGTIEFPLSGLSSGEHKIRLKVWDIANNSTEEVIHFTVTGNFTIGTISNYPNPVTTFTDIIFTHNQPDAVFTALVEVFDITGNRLDVIQTNISSDGNKSFPVRYDLNSRKIILRNGIYPYRVTVRTSEGELSSASGKMMIMR